MNKEKKYKTKRKTKRQTLSLGEQTGGDQGGGGGRGGGTGGEDCECTSHGERGVRCEELNHCVAHLKLV